MVERKLFKTKLCVLYQSGRCTRQTCSFAHGDAELRRSFGSYNVAGRRDYRVSDLRDKLDRRLSPQRRYSPGSDAGGRHTFHGLSPSRSLEKESDRKRRRKQHIDGQNDSSGSLKILDGIGDRVKDRKFTSSGSKIILQEQLKEVQSDISTLELQKHQLEIDVDEKVQEADILSSRIKELQTQLNKEKEECKRIALKIKKFIKEHNRHVRIQDELKRSQARLQKLGNQLGSDATVTGVNEEDSSINIVSDGETANKHLISPQNDVLTISSPKKTKLHVDRVTAEESIQEANLTKDRGRWTESIPSEKVSRWNVHPFQSNVGIEVEAVNDGNSNHGPLLDQGKLKRRKNISTSFPAADKLTNLGSGNLLPSTSIAAHAVDDEVETEVEKIEQVVEMASAGNDKRVIFNAKRMPFRLPPPAPISRNAYLQYAGDDENVDVVG
ncbi:zinc finger CCCH domain-containing protein 40 [Pistacia vera]|uniref:zinc finger CCCH domain-containing protein 40 n=1 Tax=Pistacia vera TaxID=55513 RepID=UPI001263D8D2|nr:zinc finger CCCH domain-containing protein 40 [Pistacia vera]